MAIEGVGSQLPAVQSSLGAAPGVERNNENERNVQEEKDDNENRLEADNSAGGVKETERGTSIDVVG
ncbi:MAG: hypothetical protein ACE5FU_15005 [Nitrospinota bacterium]